MRKKKTIFFLIALIFVTTFKQDHKQSDSTLNNENSDQVGKETVVSYHDVLRTYHSLAASEANAPTKVTRIFPSIRAS